MAKDWLILPAVVAWVSAFAATILAVRGYTWLVLVFIGLIFVALGCCLYCCLRRH
jgi:uncharacterized membrane protein